MAAFGVLLGVITALFIGGVLLFNNNLYSPMLFNGSIASTFRMTSVELQYKPESQWASVLEECGRECGLHFGILILDDMDPPLAAGGLPPKVVEAARTIPRPPYSLCAEPDSGAFSTITPAVELEAGILPQQYVIFMRDGDPAQYWYARTILVSNDEGVVRYVLLAASSPSITARSRAPAAAIASACATASASFAAAVAIPSASSSTTPSSHLGASHVVHDHRPAGR